MLENKVSYEESKAIIEFAIKASEKDLADEIEKELARPGELSIVEPILLWKKIINYGNENILSDDVVCKFLGIKYSDPTKRDESIMNYISLKSLQLNEDLVSIYRVHLK